MKRVSLAIVASLLAAATAAQAPRSLTELQTAARAGNAEAQFQLGEAYRTGAGVTTDRDQAITWYKRAADQGSEPARDALGMLLFTRGNRQEAMPLIEAAAARGDARALYILATARFNGDYVARDWPRAYAEMSRAADLGLPQARSSLAQMEPYLLSADRAKADQISATMAATAPAGIAAMARTAPPAPVAPPPSGPLALQTVPANGSSGTAFSLTPSASATPAPPPPAPAPLPATPVARPAPRPVSRSPVAATAAAAHSAPRGSWRVQLGAYGSPLRAEAQWKTLAGKYPALAGHPHAIVPAGPLFRLQAEQVAGREEAASLCRDVVASGGGCFPVAP